MDSLLSLWLLQLNSRERNGVSFPTWSATRWSSVRSSGQAEVLIVKGAALLKKQEAH